jgi:hypothetical protein
MSLARAPAGRGETRRAHAADALPPPLVWTFDGPFERCLDDLEDSLRRAIVLIGDVSRIALLIDLSLPALQQRVRAGDKLQPAWSRFVERLSGYGLPSFPRVRHLAPAVLSRRSSSPTAADLESQTCR